MNASNYRITNRADLFTVGLPAYCLGVWTHYTTSADGWARFGRVSGKGCKFMSLRVEDFNKAVEVGLMVAA